MQNNEQLNDQGLAKLSLTELRRQWAEAWQITPHNRIGRKMLEQSLRYKLREQKHGGLNMEQRKQLDQLIKIYKRNPKCFDGNISYLKPGTTIVKLWRGKHYNVRVTESGFEYQGCIFKSLSEIASTITGTRWNGWTFFDLKKPKVTA